VRTILAIILFITLAANNLLAQRFYVSSDVKKVTVNGTFNITYTFENISNDGFEEPDFSPFQLLGRPAESSSFSISNGRRSSSSSFTYSFLATKEGKFTIPGAKLKVNGKTMGTNAINIDVVKTAAVGNFIEDDGGKFMVKLELDYTTAYIGQQILLDYVIYVQSDISKFDLLNEPKYDGFFQMPIEQFNFPTRKVVINGENFYTKVMKRIALFPQQKGQFVIEPIIAQIGVPDKSQPRRGFFSSQRSRIVNVSTDSLVININSLPDDKPSLFTGAIGQFQLKNSVNKSNITTDDAVVLVQEVRGDGDEKTITPPNIDFSNDWEVYEPKVIFEKTEEYNGKFYTVKKFEYLLVPRKTGNINLEAPYSFYNPDSSSYVELKGDIFQVKVEQGTRTITADKRDVAPINDIYGITTGSGELKNRKDIAVPNSWWVFGMGLLGVLLSIIGFLKYKQIKEDAIDPEIKRRLLAEQKAKDQLQAASKFMEDGNQRAFFDEVSKTINRYLSEKYAIPFSDQNKTKIAAILNEKGISSSDIEEYLSILQSCEMALFAGQSSDKMNEIYQKAVELIIKVD
jgi:hypothetical protein